MQKIGVKTTEEWLNRVKSVRQDTYATVLEILNAFAQDHNAHQCFLMLNIALVDVPELAVDFNRFLIEENQLTVLEMTVEEMRILIFSIKDTSKRLYDEVIGRIAELSQKREESIPLFDENQMVRQVIQYMMSQARGNDKIEREYRLPMLAKTKEQLASRDLSHLVDCRLVADTRVEGKRSKPESKKEAKPEDPRNILPFSHCKEEKNYLKSLQKKVPPKIYEEIIKILHIYKLGIISAAQSVSMILGLSIEDCACLKNIILSREESRRESSEFKPLSVESSNSGDVPLSGYIEVPRTYLLSRMGQSKIADEVINRKYVNVGSDQANFVIPTRNAHDVAMQKAQNERYEYSLYEFELRKAISLIIRIKELIQHNPDANINSQYNQLVETKAIQRLYQHATNEEKQQISYLLRTRTSQTLDIFYHRLTDQQEGLTRLKDQQLLKHWQEVAHKSFLKSLDFRGEAFRKEEINRMKPNNLIDILKKRVTTLKAGVLKDNELLDRDGSKFFQVYNSFSLSAKDQGINRYNASEEHLEDFCVEQNTSNLRLPVQILQFEDEESLEMVGAMVIFYLGESTNQQHEKEQCRATLIQMLTEFFGLKRVSRHSLSQQFSQDKLTSLLKQKKLSEQNRQEIDSLLLIHDSAPELEMLVFRDPSSRYTMQEEDISPQYLPPKMLHSKILHASEDFYLLIQYIYAIYERVIRMKELLSDPHKHKLFEMLFFSCMNKNIKPKEALNTKLEDGLNMLIGIRYAFLFQSMDRLFSNATKYLLAVSECPLTNYSFRLINEENQAYVERMVREFISRGQATKQYQIRFAFDAKTTLLYVNFIGSLKDKGDIPARTLVHEGNVQEWNPMQDVVSPVAQPELSDQEMRDILICAQKEAGIQVPDMKDQMDKENVEEKPLRDRSPERDPQDIG